MKKIIIMLLASITLSFADEALFEELIKNICNVDKVKEIIAKGVNKNVMVRKDLSLYAYAAVEKNCGESAHYLSSIGAVDVGTVKYLNSYRSSLVEYYPSNRTFGDSRLKVTINNVGIGGYSNNVTYKNNNDDDYIYILARTVDINGVTFTEDLTFDRDRFGIGPYRSIELGLGFNPDDARKFPKVVNNKVSFVRQVTIKYLYNGKTYELKSPKMQENIDVKYQNYTYNPFLF